MIQNAANNDKEQYKVSTATAINNPMQTEITYTCIRTGKLEQSLQENAKKLPRSMGYLQQEMRAVEIVQNISLRSQGE
jgi:hypothetical protein